MRETCARDVREKRTRAHCTCPLHSALLRSLFWPTRTRTRANAQIVHASSVSCYRRRLDVPRQQVALSVAEALSHTAPAHVTADAL